MSDIEQTSGVYRAGTFPDGWGVPAGSQFSEERAAWVASRVREHISLRSIRRRAYLERRRVGPGATVDAAGVRRLRHLHMLREH